MSHYRRHVFFCCNERDPPEEIVERLRI